MSNTYKAYKNIDELLSLTKAKTISTLDEFRETIFDMYNVDIDTMIPKIKCEKTSIVVFDNKNFNETYVFDIINNLFEENEKLREIEYFYVNDFNTKFNVIVKSHQRRNEINTKFKNDENAIEQEILRPCVFLIQPNKNDIEIEREAIVSLITKARLEKLFSQL